MKGKKREREREREREKERESYERERSYLVRLADLRCPIYERESGQEKGGNGLGAGIKISLSKTRERATRPLERAFR